MVTLHVSIVNWNTRDSLRRCLHSLEAAVPRGESEITVVDNASSDGSAEMVRSEFPDVRLLALDNNVGFAAGNNAAIRLASSKYVLILNPDVEVPPHGLRRLMGYLEQNAGAAAVSPLLVGRDGAVHTGYYRRFPSRLQVALFWTRLARLSASIAPLRAHVLERRFSGVDPVRVDQLPGAAMLVRTEVLDTVGLMDPDYFIWFEDVDWCYRARLQECPLYVLPSVRFAHEGAASFASWDEEGRMHQFHRAFFRFLCKHGLESLRDFALPVITADLRLREVIGRLRGRVCSGPAMTRREIRDIVARYRAGESVRFIDAGGPKQLQQ